MGRNYSVSQKLLRMFAALALVIAVGGAGVFGAFQLLNNKPATEDPKKEAMDGLTDGKEAEEPKDEDDLTVNLSRDGANAKYGEISKYVLRSSFLEMGLTRIKLTGVGQPVSIPMSGNQEWVDDQRKAEISQSALFEILEKKIKEWDAEFSKLEGDELEVAIRNKVKEEILRNPVFADMLVQAFMTYPQVVEQNDWLVVFKKNLDEAYARKETDGKLVGLNAFMHYESKEAKEKADFSKLLINEESNPETGAFEYFLPAARLAELFDEFFEFDGYKKELESTDNWALEANGAAELQRTKKSTEQENKAVYVFTHYTKMKNVSIRLGFNAYDRRVELFKDVPGKTTKTDDPGTTPDPKTESFRLTINYVYEDGSKAAETYSKMYAKGAFYSVPSPKANKPGFTADRANVDGGPIVKDTTEKVTYYGSGTKTFVGTINYLYRADGSTAAPSFVKTMKDGESVTRRSPDIANYTADKPSVTLKISGGDATVNVYYDKNGKTREVDFALTLKCVGSDGSLLRTVPKGRLVEGASFTVYAESIPGWKARQSSVSGTMPGRDHEVTIIYDKDGTTVTTYPLTLECVDKATGYVLSTVPQGQYAEGASFTAYAIAIAGYTADQASISGTMPGRAHTVRITYTRIKDGDGTKKPEADPERAPGYNPGIGDNKPTDGPGQNESEKPAVVDHDNTPPSTPSMPNDNRNDDGKDTTKPVTNPIVDKADDAPAQDIGTGEKSNASDSKGNSAIDLNDPISTNPRSESAVPAASAQQAAPVPAKEKVYLPPVEPDPTPQPAAATPAPASTPAPQQDNSSAGQHEPALEPLNNAVNVVTSTTASTPAPASYTAAPASEPAAQVEEAAPVVSDYNSGAGTTLGGAGDLEEVP